MNTLPENYTTLFKQISKLYTDTKDSMIKAYWMTGKYIIQTENKYINAGGDENPSRYGKKLIERLSQDLSVKYGKGFSASNIKNMRRFYRLYEKRQPVAQLEWSKYVALFTVKDEEERRELEKLAVEENLTRFQLKKFIELYRLRKGSGAARPDNEENRPERGALYRYSLIEDRKLPLNEGEVLVDCGFNTWRKIGIENIRDHEGKKVFQLKKEKGKYFITEGFGRKKEKLLYTYRAYVERVIDGDTLWVNIDCGFNIMARQKVRLRGVDTPEKVFPEGKRAGDFVKRVLGKCPFVIIRTYKTDLYDRYVSDLFYLPGETDPERVAVEGKLLNSEIIDRGLGRRI
jgi:endonuclease YncB( thermonuclease family)